MIKLILYLTLTAVGIVASLFNPLAGAIAAVNSYLFNPAAILMPGNTLPFQMIVTAAFIIGLIAHWKPGLPRVNTEQWPLAALWVFLIYAVMTSTFAQFSTAIALQRLNEVFKTLIVTTLLLWCIRNETQLRTFFDFAILGVLHAAAMHVIGPKLGYISFWRSREYGVLPDPQRAVMVCFVPLLLIIATTGSRYQKIFAGITLLFALDSIVNTYERTGFVAVAVEFLLIFVLGGRIAWKLAPFALIVGLVMIVRFMPSNYVGWIKTIETPTQEASANSRFEINKGSLRMFKEHPFGVGYRNYPYVAYRFLSRRVLSQEGFRSAHNGFLTILCETGFIGFIAWFSGFIGAVRLLRRLRKARDASGLGVGGSTIPLYALALEVGLYGWFVNNLTQADHEVDPAFWFVALAIIMTRLYAMQKKQAVAAAPPAVVALPPRRRAAVTL